MNINSNVLKLSGQGELDAPLEHSKTYALACEVEVEDGGLRNNHDGSHDRIWKGKLIRAQVHTQTGDVKTKDKNSQSVRLRRAILGLKEQYEPTLDDDAWYERTVGGIRHYLPMIIDLIYKQDSTN
jgi:hypothetical protein